MLRIALLMAILTVCLVGSMVSAQVTIEVAILDDVTEEEQFASMIEDFEANHPGIKVELMPQYREFFDQLAVQVAGGVAPDIVLGYGPFPGLAIRSGAMLDLMPFVERDGLHDLLDDFAPGAIGMHTVEDHVYGFPKSTAVGVVYYNRDMFAQAGLGTPDPDWTWEDFADTARRTTVSDGDTVTRWGYALNGMWTWAYPWFVSAGVDFSDPYRVAFDSPEAAHAGRYLQELTQLEHMNMGWGEFPDQRAAMTTSGSWELRSWLNLQLPLEVAPFPTGPAGKASQTNNDLIGITESSKHPEEAWAFLKWFYSQDTQRAYLERFALPPALRSLASDWIDAITGQILAEGNQPPARMSTFIEAGAYVAEEPQFANAQIVDDYIMPALNQVLKEGKAVETTFAEMARTATAVLQEDAN